MESSSASPSSPQGSHDASPGAEEEETHEFQELTTDLEAWHGDIQSRLRLIPDPSETLKYKPTCTAIQQLQGAIQEVVERHSVVQSSLTPDQPSSVDLQALLDSMAEKQERLFESMVHFLQLEVVRLADVLEEAERLLGEGPLTTEGYVDQQTQLYRLKGTREELSSCEADLLSLNDAPHPLKVPPLSLEQQQQGTGPSPLPSPATTPGVYAQFTDLHSRLVLLLLKCQELAEKFEEKIDHLEKELHSHRERFMADLSEVEVWLAKVYSLLCLEPAREATEGYRSREQSLEPKGVVGGGGEVEGLGGQQLEMRDSFVAGGGRERVKYPSEPCSFDSVDGSLMMMMEAEDGSPFDKQVLNSSVDIALEDKEYEQEVLKRVLSPVEGEGETAELEMEGGEGHVDPLLFEMEEEVGRGEEEEEGEGEREEVGSVSSESTLRSEPQRRAGVSKGVDSCERVQSLAEEFSEGGVEVPEEWVTGEGGEVGESGEEEPGEIEEANASDLPGTEEEEEEEEEGSRRKLSQEEGETSLQRVKELHVLPMEHDLVVAEPGSDQPDYNPSSHDIDYILGNLESVLGQLTIQSQKVKRSMANISFVMNTVPVETAAELQERLAWIKQHWEPLAGRVRHRMAQMKFEKAQKETLENIQEVVRELENQPETNLLPEEVEEKFSQLMDFIIDLETFESQKAELIGQLESTLHPLTQFPQESAAQLRRTTEQLKQGYETVTEKVKQQKVLLERWRDQWNKFSRELSHFEDWVGRAEELVTMETYGHSLTEMEAHVAAVKYLKQQVSVEEAKVQYLIDLGNTILACVQRQGEAERYIDTKLSEVEERWFNLVTQGDGALDQRESAGNKVLINWRAYTDMHRGTQSFITQMVKMVGTEPLEASGGNTTLLPTYRTYADQLRAMEVQYKRLQSLAEGLSSNPHVGGGAAIQEEMENLSLQWGPLKDNIVDSLDMLRREHEGWVLGKLQQMSSLVVKVEEVVKREVAFVEEFPLETLMEEDANVFLREVDELVASQDKLGQLETDCTHIEEELLGRQIQLETAGHPASELDTEATLTEHQRLQQARDDLQTMSDVLLSVLNVFFLQLQLLQKVQEAEGIISVAMDFVGDQNGLEATLADIQLKLSEDHLERLCSDAYDLGSVSEEYEASLEMEHNFKIPSYDKVVQVNHTLTKKVEELSDSANSAKVRLQLFIEWWAEYCSNYSEISPWLEGAESRVVQLVARGESTQAPLVSPVELLQDAKELEGEMTEKAVVLNALTSTGQNILDEIESKGAPPSEISDQLLDVKERWESLASRLKAQLVKLEGEANRFNQFLTGFTAFVKWLGEFRDTLYDEVCVQIPHRAAEETILHHRAQLEDFRHEVESRESQFLAMTSESDVWADHLVPDECHNDLPSPSEESGEEATDFPFDVQLPFIKNRMKMVEKKWSNVKQLLRERENQLELSLGTTVVFLQTVAELLAWLEEKLQLEAISATPPASVESLRGFVEIVESTRGELTNRQLPVRRGLERTAGSLKAQLSGANAENVEQQLAEVSQQWQRVEETLDSRETALSALISDIEGYWLSVAELETWLEAGEGRMEECGPIGANLPRLVEQSVILETLNEDILSRMKDSEELHSRAMNIIKACCEESGDEILHRSQELQSRFDALSQLTLESRELCDEATSAMQEFQVEYNLFCRWLEEVEGNLAKRRKVKYPVGTVQTELEEHYDFMRECEQQTDQYSDLYCHGNHLAAKYKPSDALDAVMTSLHNRWAGHVTQMGERSEELLGIQELWEKYEGEVKKLLNWIMAEAERFSCEVTTLGDKGIKDHIGSCKELSNTLGKKHATIAEIQDLAEILRAEDGAKKNGTSDVESRWQDVHQHWNSLCKLLGETLLRLEATFAEVRHVLQITEEEFDWLERCEHAAGVRRTTHGNLQIVQEEIDAHYQLSQEIREHQNDAEYIQKSVDFLVEHSHKSEREELAVRAKDYVQRYHCLLTSVDTYVHHMQDSIPVWKEFNDQYHGISEWLNHVDGELCSEHTQPGNVSVTERSLENSEGLLHDIQDHQETLVLLRTTTKTLCRLCIPEDQAIVQGRVEEVEGEMGRASEQTSSRIEELEQRLKSWEVFPVEEAKMVQEFLVQAEEEVEEEMAEDLSAGELQEKLKRLESLQQLQLCNEDKVTTIERSAESEEVRKALQKNPDISKERSNLLQGWSHVSSTLKDRLGRMRRRAEMVQDLEEALHTSSEGLQAYQEFLEQPLPPSVLLAARQQELHNTGVTLHNSCQSGVTNLLDVLEQYTTATDIQVPTHLRERAAAINEKFQVLVGKATERTNQITETLDSWREFQSGLEGFSMWLRSASSELYSLKVIEMFLMEFSSLESRLELLCEEVEERRGEYERLSGGSQRHLFGEEEEVVRMRKRLEKAERGWQSVQKGVEELPDAMKPWKDLTDRFDELSIWLEELEERVESDLVKEVKEEEEEEVEGGGDPSDTIVKIKDHLLKMNQQKPKLQDLTEQAAGLLTFDLCQQYDPAHNLREECKEIEERWDKLEERLQLSLQDVEDKAASWKEEAVRSIKEIRQMEQCVTTMTGQIKDQEALIDQLKARLADAPTLGSRPKNSLSLPTLLSLLCILAAIVVLYLFLAVEPPAVIPI